MEQQNLTFMVEDSQDSKEIDSKNIKQRNVSVPRLVGMSIDEANSKAEQLGLTFEIEE